MAMKKASPKKPAKPAPKAPSKGKSPGGYGGKKAPPFGIGKV